MDANSRFKVVDLPRVAPALCFICRSIKRGPFVDTGVTDSFLGVFYICRGCLVEMHRQLPQPDIEITDEDEAQAAALSESWLLGFNVAKEEINARLVELVSSVRPADSGDTSVPESETVPDDPKGAGGSSDSPDSTGKQADGPTSVKKSARVSGNSGDGAKFPDIGND